MNKAETHWRLLALDQQEPSGNYNEGKGTTGYCIFKDNELVEAGQISSKDFQNQFDYWREVLTLINEVDIVVCEDYRLYSSQANSQINSNLETPQLIGVIKYFCYQNEIPLHLQMAAEVKTRWSNEVMLKTNLITKGKYNRLYNNDILLEHHSIDAFRHGIHFIKFKLNKKRRK